MSDSILEGFGEPVEQVEEEQYQDDENEDNHQSPLIAKR